MTVVETVLVFVGIPAGIILLLVIAVFGRSTLQSPHRYRPGRAWTYPPVWFVPHPEALPEQAGARLAIESAIAGTSTTTAVGGASGEW